MVRAPRERFEQEIWCEFGALHAELNIYFADTVDHLIQSAMKSDGDDTGLDASQIT